MKRLTAILALVLLLCMVFPAAAENDLMPIPCPQEGFSTMMPADCTAQYTAGTGLQIYPEHAGYIPYVIVSRRPSDMQFSNPVNYLNNVYREYMENRYGDDMIGMNPAKNWEIGGKTLIGARYLYKVGTTTVCLLQLIELRDDGDVEYSAKFIENEDEKTMAALDAAVRNYAPETAEPDADIVMPADLSGTEVNMEDGRYWAAVADADRIEQGGFFTLRLYLQDLYPADRIDGLAEGAKVRVNGQDYTVAAVIPHNENLIEIKTQEELDGYIAFQKQSDSSYNALVNGWVPCTHLADQKIMLPLANDCSFTWIRENKEVGVYDAYSFIKLLKDIELSQYNTMVEFTGGLLMTVVHSSAVPVPDGN